LPAPRIARASSAGRGRQTVQRLEADLIIQADQVAAISRDKGGKYHTTTSHGGASASGGAVWGAKLQEALTPKQPADVSEV
jgi:uncharacterized membrane protein